MNTIEGKNNESADPNSLRIQSIAEQAPWMSEEHINKIVDAHTNQGKRKKYIYENRRARMINLPSQTGQYLILPDIPSPPSLRGGEGLRLGVPPTPPPLPSGRGGT